jgi:hypothetical protein
MFDDGKWTRSALIDETGVKVLTESDESSKAG